MRKWERILLYVWCLLIPAIVTAGSQIIGGLPFTLTNGTVADATQVMADFNQIVNNTNANGAKNGVNNDITALTALTTPLTVTQGGTGLVTLAANNILFGNGTAVMGSGRCSMDANSSIACSSSTAFNPQYNLTNSTADANPSFVVFSKNRAGGNSGNADALGNLTFRGFANSSPQNAANIFCAQNGAAVGSNVPSLCSVLTSTTAGQLNVNFSFPPTNGTSGQVLTTNGSGVTSWIGAAPTVQRFITGGPLTYTAPANVVRQHVRMVGGGGGGAATNTNNGAAGTSSSFQVNSTGTAWTAVFGNGGATGATAGATGGTGGTDGSTGTLVARFAGANSSRGLGQVNGLGGYGGSSVFGGGGDQIGASNNGVNGKTNTGSGGSAASINAAANPPAGGAAGEYVEFWVQGMTTATYTVGGGGNGGAAGGNAGGNGAAGIIIVEEFYQ